jgi:hypothetical protein
MVGETPEITEEEIMAQLVSDSSDIKSDLLRAANATQEKR